MTARLTINPKGSVKIEGDFELYDGEGNRYDLGGREVIKLCRCGHTKNAPFCDSTHREIGFDDESKARALPPIQPKA